MRANSPADWSARRSLRRNKKWGWIAGCDPPPKTTTAAEWPGDYRPAPRGGQRRCGVTAVAETGCAVTGIQEALVPGGAAPTASSRDTLKLVAARLQRQRKSCRGLFRHFTGDCRRILPGIFRRAVHRASALSRDGALACGGAAVSRVAWTAGMKPGAFAGAGLKNRRFAPRPICQSLTYLAYRRANPHPAARAEPFRRRVVLAETRIEPNKCHWPTL